MIKKVSIGIALLVVTGFAISTPAFAQTAPTLDDPADPAAILEDSGLQTVNLTGISGGGDGGQALSVTATSDNTGLIPDPTVNYTSPDATGSLDYTPVAGASGSAVITVTVDDGVDTPVAQTFTVTVTAVDDASVAAGDTKTVTEDDLATTIDVRGNDTDIDSSVEDIDSVTQPTNGSVVITNAGVDLTYEPNGDYCNNGWPTDDFTYTLTGGSVATVAVTVTCVDDAPVAVDDTKTVTEDDAATAIDVLANDTDVDAGPKTIASATDPAGGTVVVAGDGLSLTYEPDPDFCNSVAATTDDFEYTLAPGGDVGTVAVTVDCAPDAVDDPATVDEDSISNAIDVLANDDLGDGSATVTSVSDPVNGTAAINGTSDGVEYTPDADYCNTNGGGTDDFTYTVADGDGDSSTATVAVTVDCAPDAVDDPATVDEDSISNAIDVLANDDLGDGSATVTSVSDPVNGTAAINGTSDGVEYTPDADYCNTNGGGTDDFTYTVADGDGDSSTATVAVTVDCAPDAVDDPATVDEDSISNAIDVLANDDLGDGSATVTSVSDPVNGTAAINGTSDGVEYTPDADYCNTNGGGTDDFTYTVADGDGDSSTATVAVTVDCAPDAVDDPATVDEDSISNAIDVLANDDLGDGSATVTSVSDPVNGTAAINGTSDGVEYTPDADYCNTNGGGTDDFTYTVADGDGDSSTGTVAVTVTCINDAPSFTKGADQAIAEDAGAQSVPGWATALSTGPANESDQTLAAFNVVSNTNPGIFISGPAVDPSTGALTYEIKPDRTGIADIGITLTDDCGGGAPPASCGSSGVDTSAPQGFKITVAPVNDPPSFSNLGDVTREAGTGAQSVAWASNVVAGPPNESGQSVAFTVTNSACTPIDLLNAGPAVSANGNLLYTPKDGVTGSCELSVKLSDNCGLVPGTPSCGGSGVNAESAVVDFTLTLVSALAPIADPQSVATDGSNPLTIVLTGQDNGGGTPLSFQILEPVTDQDTGTIVSDTGPFFGTLDTTMPATNSGGVSADVVYTPDGPALTNAAIIGTQSVLLKTVAVVSGDIVANDPAAVVDIQSETTTPLGFAVKGDVLNVDPLAVIAGDALCNSGSYVASCSVLAVPVFDTLPPFLVGSVNSLNVNVPKNQSGNIAPGIHGDITVRKNATLTFAAGKYSVNSISTENGAVLAFSGPAEVKVAGRVFLDNNNSVGSVGAGGDVVFYVAGLDGTSGKKPPKAVDVVGNNSVLFANFYAPNGTINIKNNTQLTGSLIAKRVEVYNNSVITLDSAFSEVPDQFSFEGTDQAGLVSDPAVVLINADDACRDDSGQVVAIAAFANEAATDGATSIDITLRGCESTDVPVIVTATDGTHGTVSGEPVGPAGPPYEFVVTYTPNDPVPNERDSFSFTFDNGSSMATAIVEVNEPPCDAVDVVDGSSISTDETNPLTIMLSACDPEGETLVFATTPDFSDCATCALSAPAPIVDNRPGFSSVNVVLTHSETVATSAFLDFSATSTSGSAVSDPGYTIEVEPANLPPNAVDNSFSGSLGGAINGNVLANDTDPNLDSLTAALVGPGPGFASTFELNPDGSFSYIHNGTSNFSDSFTYEASDGALTDTATVTLTIVAANITVSVDKSGSAGSEDSLITSNPAGISCGAGCASDSAVFMTTSDIRLAVSAATGFLFTGWSGDADCVDGSIIPIANRSCTANFVVDTTTPPPPGDPKMITVLKDGSGDGTVSTTPAGINCGVGCATQSAMISGDPRILLKAVAATGSVFTGFAGGPSNDCADGVLFATVDTTCSATFNLAGRTLTILFAGDDGNVDSQPSGISCSGEPCSAAFTNGDTVTLSARPNSAGGSASWSGPCVEDTSFPDGRKATVLMTADATCTVTFTN